MQLFSAIIALVFPTLCFSKRANIEDKYIHMQIVKKKDTIHYHIYSERELNDQKNTLLFIHGSGGHPMYSEVVYGTIQVMEDGAPENEVQRGNMTQEEAVLQNNSLFTDLKNIESDPTSTSKQ